MLISTSTRNVCLVQLRPNTMLLAMNSAAWQRGLSGRCPWNAWTMEWHTLQAQKGMARDNMSEHMLSTLLTMSMTESLSMSLTILAQTSIRPVDVCKLHVTVHANVIDIVWQWRSAPALNVWVSALAGQGASSTTRWPTRIWSPTATANSIPINLKSFSIIWNEHDKELLTLDLWIWLSAECHRALHGPSVSPGWHWHCQYAHHWHCHWQCHGRWDLFDNVSSLRLSPPQIHIELAYQCHWQCVTNLSMICHWELLEVRSSLRGRQNQGLH